ncbi:MAG: hypothetical protein KBF63_12105 [Rhodoferax sp.]|nr:hypothetical protein [Rhodoferax sp.]MBP9930012.1 hypothetical protein [Rhodoferax sp.]HQZ04379.1 hypothetical protein [Burkholderiaceae bacterium]
MNGLTDFIQRVASIAIKLLLVLAAAVFLISLLLAAIVVMLAVSIWALLTGRKPEPIKVFSQFRQSSARFTPGGWPGGPRGGRPGQPEPVVVDVQAHEVPDKPATDGKSRPGASGGGEPMTRVVH